MTTNITQDEYDVFISHASEDKHNFVRPLAKLLIESNLRVWYDEFELYVGDSLREAVDRGLAKSRYGIVVLSKAFLSKHWPRYELNGLFAREVEGQKIILPVWYGITKSDILRYSPILADKYALSSQDMSIEEIVKALVKVIAV